ncbi:MAG TPA: hypothetical protein VGI12_09060 [Vicinamibacterales bacterium]
MSPIIGQPRAGLRKEYDRARPGSLSPVHVVYSAADDHVAVGDLLRNQRIWPRWLTSCVNTWHHLK